ncbi:MAG TPA: hypothetical protein VHT05_11915 [Candidatus Elarobacter sp.]|jgi:hypothetical protein|nr:hypothetical protein [Candidatus Elarobacter sp.]
MRRFPTTLLIVVIVIIGIVIGTRMFWPTEATRYQQVQAVRNQRSELHVSETITHSSGAIAREQWRLDNDNGTSSASYSAENRAGTRIAKFTAPIQGYDVTFAFQELVQDGVWELQTRPLRGNTNNVYTIDVAQVDGDRHGTHKFVFSDPHYLATTAGRQYEIHLDRNKPVPDLITLNSTSSADPRYQKVVDDFASFGPPQFKATVAAARVKLLRS